jgi:hypothetical protein
MNTAVLILNYAVTAIVALLCFRRRAFKLLDPAWAFIGGYFINYCLRPTLFLIDPELGSAYWAMFDDAIIRRGFNSALIFAMVGLIAFAIGYLAFERTSLRVAGKLPATDLRSVAQGRILPWITFCFLLAACAGLYGFISEAGWVGTILELLQGNQRDGFMLVILGHGNYMFAMQLSLIGWALICIHWVGIPSTAGGGARALRRILQIGWFIVTLSIWVAFGERSSLLAVLFIPIALLQAFRSNEQEASGNVRKKPRLIAIIVVVLFFAVAGPIGLFLKGLDASPAAAISMSISAWDSFEFTVIAQNDVRTKDLFWGKSYWGDLFYTWLPRALFPSKPERYGTVLVQDLLAPELMANEGATFPPGIFIEAFTNFGYVGLVVVPILIGIFCRAVDFRLRSSDWFWSVLMAVFFPNLASFRSFGGFLALLMANGLVVFAVVWACKAIRAICNLELGQTAVSFHGANR